MLSEKEIFQRTELLLGTEMMVVVASKKIILFGTGGVGSWCAESLIRSGIHHLTIVDSDNICVSNINRQLQATTLNVGKSKVEELKQRLLQINSHAEINAIQKVYNPETAESFNLGKYDYIIDAIDSLSNKIDLIRRSTKTGAEVFSSMGAGLKIDPTQIRVAEFWKVKGCPLGYLVRKKMRKGELPSKDFLCVYSEELRENKGTTKQIDSSAQENEGMNLKKAVINGSIVHITAIFGFTIAGLIIKDIYTKNCLNE